MDEASLSASIARVNALLAGKPVYVSLSNVAARGNIVNVIPVDNKFRMQLKIQWMGQVYTNPSKAALAMQNEVRKHLSGDLSMKQQKHVDGWGRVHVHADGRLYTLNSVLPPEIRRGLQPFIGLPPAPEKNPFRKLEGIMNGEGVMIGGDGHAQGNVTRKRASSPMPPAMTKRSKQFNEANEAIWKELRPHMTELAYHLNTKGTDNIIEAALRKGSRWIIMVTDSPGLGRVLRGLTTAA